MPDIRYIFGIFVFAAIFASALSGLIVSLRRRMAPLLSIIKGRFRFRFTLLIVGVIEGSWQNRRVRVALKYGRKKYAELVVRLSCVQPPPASFKVRPKLGILGVTDLRVANLFSGHKFDLPEDELTVWVKSDDEPVVRQYLNSARLFRTKRLFTGSYDALEVQADPDNGSFLKLRIDGHSGQAFRNACHNAIDPGRMTETLEMLVDFEMADATSLAGMSSWRTI